MNSSKFMAINLFIAATFFGFTPNVLMAADTTTAPTSGAPVKAAEKPKEPTETSKALADMKEEIKKLKDEVEKLKRELQERKDRAEQKRAAKAAAKKQKDLQEANSPAPAAH